MREWMVMVTAISLTVLTVGIATVLVVKFAQLMGVH